MSINCSFMGPVEPKNGLAEAADPGSPLVPGHTSTFGRGNLAGCFNVYGKREVQVDSTDVRCEDETVLAGNSARWTIVIGWRMRANWRDPIGHHSR